MEAKTNLKITKIGELETGIQWENNLPESKNKYVGLKIEDVTPNKPKRAKIHWPSFMISKDFYEAIISDEELRKLVTDEIIFSFNSETAIVEVMNKLEKNWKGKINGRSDL